MVNTWVGEQRWYFLAPKSHREAQELLHCEFWTWAFSFVRDVKGDTLSSCWPYLQAQLPASHMRGSSFIRLGMLHRSLILVF